MCARSWGAEEASSDVEPVHLELGGGRRREGAGEVGILCSGAGEPARGSFFLGPGRARTPWSGRMAQGC